MIKSKYLCEILEIIFIGMLLPYWIFFELMKSLKIDFLFREILDIVIIGIWFPYLILLELKKITRIVFLVLRRIYDNHVLIMHLRLYMYPWGVIDNLLFYFLLVGIIVYITLWIVRILFILDYVLPLGLSDIWNDLKEGWVAMFPISWSTTPGGNPSHGGLNNPNPQPHNPNSIMPESRRREVYSDEWEPIANTVCRFPLRERHGFHEEVCVSWRHTHHLGGNGNYLMPTCHLQAYKDLKKGVIANARSDPNGSVFRCLPNVNPHGLHSILAEINQGRQPGEHGTLKVSSSAKDGLFDLYRIDSKGNKVLVTNESARHELLWAYRNRTHPNAWPEVNRFGEIIE